ncbi:MAG: hypothetical protein QGG40_02785 [Myxococcota bacterium]|jgi:uncharacterized membrane protein|nr:hypothetical protein [Myxococcota bacterium]
MLEIITLAGPFGGLSTLLGITAIALFVTGLIRPPRERLVGLAIGLTAAAFFIGLLGEGIGMKFVVTAVEQATPETQTALWRRGCTVAGYSTTVGAFWAALNALLYGLVRFRSVD